jgi:hypothetical protein
MPEDKLVFVFVALGTAAVLAVVVAVVAQLSL